MAEKFSPWTRMFQPAREKAGEIQRKARQAEVPMADLSPDARKAIMAASARGEEIPAYRPPSGPSTIFDNPKALAIAEAQRRVMQEAAAMKTAEYEARALAAEEAQLAGYRPYKPGG